MELTGQMGRSAGGASEEGAAAGATEEGDGSVGGPVADEVDRSSIGGGVEGWMEIDGAREATAAPDCR